MAEDAASSSSSEGDIIKPRSVTKRSVTQSPISDSDTEVDDWKKDDSDCEEIRCTASTPQDASSSSTPSCRSSDRIKKRQSREFRMPSKDAVFEKIPSTKSPGKSLAHLQPRNLGNEYTRVTSRYNQDLADTYVTSGDSSSLDEFIDDDMVSDNETGSGSAGSEDKKRKRARHYVKKSKRKLRRVPQSTPSTDTSDAEDEDRSQPELSASNDVSITKRSDRKQRLLESSSSDGESESDKEAVQVRRKRRKNGSLIDSDISDSDAVPDDNTRPDVNQRLCSNPDSDANSESAEMNRNISLSRRRQDISDDDDDDDDDSSEEKCDYDESGRHQARGQIRGLSGRAQLMEDKREAKRSLLQELKRSKGVQRSTTDTD